MLYRLRFIDRFDNGSTVDPVTFVVHRYSQGMVLVKG